MNIRILMKHVSPSARAFRLLLALTLDTPLGRLPTATAA
jgi:hypothetical protein